METCKSKELTEQVMKLNREVKALEKQREEALDKEKFDKGAVDLHNMYQSYIGAGFTAEQAWELTTIAFGNLTKRTLF